RELGARPPTRSTTQGIAGLTGREVEIIRLVAARRSNKEIGAALGISARTAVLVGSAQCPERVWNTIEQSRPTSNAPRQSTLSIAQVQYTASSGDMLPCGRRRASA